MHTILGKKQIKPCSLVHPGKLYCFAIHSKSTVKTYMLTFFQLTTHQ